MRIEHCTLNPKSIMFVPIMQWGFQVNLRTGRLGHCLLKVMSNSKWALQVVVAPGILWESQSGCAPKVCATCSRCDRLGPSRMFSAPLGSGACCPLCAAMPGCWGAGLPGCCGGRSHMWLSSSIGFAPFATCNDRLDVSVRLRLSATQGIFGRGWITRGSLPDARIDDKKKAFLLRTSMQGW